VRQWLNDQLRLHCSPERIAQFEPPPPIDKSQAARARKEAHKLSKRIAQLDELQHDPHGGTELPSSDIKSRHGPPFLLDDRIVSLDEASAISDLSKDTLRRCHQRKELEIIELSPRRRGIRLSVLWAFIEARAA
jgi:hypothetical protein